jgi:hypothetical protein
LNALLCLQEASVVAASVLGAPTDGELRAELATANAERQEEIKAELSQRDPRRSP